MQKALDKKRIIIIIVHVLFPMVLFIAATLCSLDTTLQSSHFQTLTFLYLQVLACQKKQNAAAAAAQRGTHHRNYFRPIADKQIWKTYQKLSCLH